MTEIHPIRVGIDTCYLLRGERNILIDGGGFGRNNGDEFLRGLAALKVDPLSIALIIVTHGHWDHIAALDFIQRATRARVAAHPAARLAIETGRPSWPPGVTGYGVAMSALASLLINARVAPVRVDLLMNEAFSLAEYGIRGRVVPTPGHSAGSLAVILEDGAAFVGDMAMNDWYLRFKPGLPILAEDWPTLIRSWRRILPQVRRVYPAHGPDFPVEVIEKALAEKER